MTELTSVTGRVVAELVAAIEGVAHADKTPVGLSDPPDKTELNLKGSGVRIAGIGRLELCSWVTTASCEQLGRVVNLGILCHVLVIDCYEQETARKHIPLHR